MIFLIAFVVNLAKSEQVDIEEVSVLYTPKKTNSKYDGVLGFVVGPILFVLSFVGIWFN